MVRTPRLGAVLALLVFCSVPPARAEWTVRSTEVRPGADKAIEFLHSSLVDEGSGSEAEIRLALFSPQKASLRVIDQPASEQSLGEVMQKGNFLAGVNGGYFDEAGAPVGLLRSGGKTISPFRRAKLLSGVVTARTGRVEIFRASDFSARQEWPEALQCGPFLVDRGKAVAGLNDQRAAERTFILTTKEGRVALGNCSSVTLAQLANLLASFQRLGVKRALNLDGGSSSAFWCRTAEKTVSLTELKSVRDFLVVAPRSTR